MRPGGRFRGEQLATLQVFFARPLRTALHYIVVNFPQILGKSFMSFFVLLEVVG
jgi:hypothetical protein